MRRVRVLMHGVSAGLLEERDDKSYCFTYADVYRGPPLSLTMPVEQKQYCFQHFPPFFDGLLPEGFQLEALLRQYKVDRHDHFSQLIIVGRDLVGAVTVEALA